MLLVLEDGHWADAPTLLLLRHLARAPAARALLLLATFRDTEADVPAALVRDARRPAAVRRRHPAAAGGALRRGGGGVRAPRGRRRPGAGPAELARDDQRPHRRQRLPGLRAVAGAGRDRAASRWSTARSGSTALAGRARHPRERSRGRQPAPRTSGARDQRRAGARGHRRGGVRAGRPAPRRRPARPSCAAALEEAVAQRHDRGGPLAQARLPLHPRARSPGAL